MLLIAQLLLCTDTFDFSFWTTRITMKFLLPLVVVALICGLSESRIVSKCELKAKFENSIPLPRSLVKYKEQIFAIVACEVERRSKLDTSVINVDGYRVTTTTAKPGEQILLTTAKSNETVVEAKTTAKPSQPMSTSSGMDASSVVPMRRRRDTHRKGSDESNSMEADSEESNSMEYHSEKSNSTAMPSVEEGMTPDDSYLEYRKDHSMEASRDKRKGKRRGRRSEMPEEPAKAELKESLADILVDEELKFNEEELMDDDNHIEFDQDHKGKIRARRSSRRKSKSSEKSEESNESNESKQEFVPWSVGYYGIFQLSDSHFCDSGYRWSRNVCKSSCTAFTDDDIMDDLACFVKSGYWRYVLTTASIQCKRAIKTYFDDC